MFIKVNIEESLEYIHGAARCAAQQGTRPTSNDESMLCSIQGFSTSSRSPEPIPVLSIQIQRQQ